MATKKFEPKDLVRRMEMAKTVNNSSSYKAVCDAICYYLSPDSNKVSDEPSYELSDRQQLVNNTGELCLDEYTNFVVSNLCPLNTKFVSLDYPMTGDIERDLMVYKQLEAGETNLKLALEKSNFQVMLRELVHDAALIGTFCVTTRWSELFNQIAYVTEDGRCIVAVVDKNGQIVELYWEEKCTLDKVFLQYGDDWFPEKRFTELYCSGETPLAEVLNRTQVTLITGILPNTKDFGSTEEESEKGRFKTRVIAKTSVMANNTEDSLYHELETTYYSDMPTTFGRMFRRKKGAYGDGLGKKAIIPARVANKIQLDAMVISEGLTKPDMNIPNSVDEQEADDGSRRYHYDPLTGDGVSYLQSTAKLGEALQQLEKQELFIKLATRKPDIDLGKQRSAQQATVDPNLIDRLRAVAPDVANIIHEGLIPIIRRTLSILHERGQVDLYGLDLDKIIINISSPITQSGAMEEAIAIDRIIKVISPLITADPLSIDNIDVRALITKLAKSNAVSDVVRSSNEVATIRQARQQQAQQQEDTQNAKTDSETQLNLRKAENEGQ